MLTVKNLHAGVESNDILHGVNLEIKPGEVHVIMGPNGSGKSTLSSVLAGRPEFSVTEGSAQFLDQDLLDLEPEQRAALGVFLSFQYPVAIPGVNNLFFLRTAYNSLRKARGESEVDAMDFLSLIKQPMALLDMDDKYKKRAVNDGFSGGEKKRNEILQLLVLQPKLAILDETDSGLDIDALQTVAKGINEFRNSDNAVLMVTHYQRLLNYVEPDFIHVMKDGRIVESGDKSLALKLEERGYADYQ